MTNLAGRIHKMLGILAVLLVAVVGLQSHTGPYQSLAAGGPSAMHGDDSGWGP
ncbi:hypothetical protein ABZX88_03680 [Kitasatospora aureofaciens]|uniref:hypothetical protein n=1 Tax=Kitasatospora aureofaciens TaxID=1894 RepID=UPI00131EAA2E|nr:hypothetical protein [Kitasatospora aureofaciens]HJD84650.1 hypothetical protein [Kitasatospora aureofaciens]